MIRKLYHINGTWHENTHDAPYLTKPVYCNKPCTELLANNANTITL